MSRTLSARGVSFSFPQLFRPLLVDVDLDVSLEASPPERIGFIGPNGHGKTTLLQILMGIRRPDRGVVTVPARGIGFAYLPQAVVEGDLDMSWWEVVTEPLADLLAARDELAAVGELMASSAGVAPGDPARLLAQYGEIQSRFEAHGGYELEARIDRVLTGLGLGELAHDRQLGELSCGQRTRLGLARVLLTPAEIVLLDEPTNHLDAEALAWLESYIASMRAPVVLVSHDQRFLERTATKIWSLEYGIFEQFRGTFAEYETLCRERFERQKHEHEMQAREIRRLEDAYRKRMGWSVDKEKEKYGGPPCNRGYISHKSSKLAKRAKAIRSRIEQTLETRRKELPKIDRELALTLPAPADSPPIPVRLEGVTKAFAAQALFSDLDLTVRAGERIAIVGANGSGKSTLLNLIAGRIPPDTGKVRVAARCRWHYYTQTHFELPVGEVILECVAASTRDTAARTLLGCLGFQRDDVLKRIAELSHGQLARVALARCLLSGANLLLLDEPTNHLDLRARRAVESLLAEYRGTVIYVSHDRQFCERLGGRALQL
ncbi:MAG: ABC-F family ATP-binding cassette domain-containing protein [Candidatus Schekmanbacteria bacterium]|nr:ABC-F family ATP-binding cassette domain-containing protein [Candidatus Schekmanbacteria bacterium]